MPSLLIRNVDEALHARLKERAADHHRSLEAEVRALLRAGVVQPETPEQGNLVELARRLFGREHGVELDNSARGTAPESLPPDFSGPEYGPED